MVIVHTGIPKNFTPAGLQAIPQMDGDGGSYQTRQKQANNRFWTEVLTEATTPPRLSSSARTQLTTLSSPTPSNAATSLPDEAQGTIIFVAASAATLVFAVIAFVWILKRTKKKSEKIVQRTIQA